MPSLSHSDRRHETGSTLVIAIFVIAMLAVFIGLALDYTTNTGSVSRRARDYTARPGARQRRARRRLQTLAVVHGRQPGREPSASYTTTAQILQHRSATVHDAINTASARTGYTLTSP